jgi:hypothetical protein
MKYRNKGDCKCVSKIRNLEVDGNKIRGRGKITWKEGVDKEMKKRGLTKEMAIGHRQELKQ